MKMRWGMKKKKKEEEEEERVLSFDEKKKNYELVFIFVDAIGSPREGSAAP